MVWLSLSLFKKRGQFLQHIKMKISHENLIHNQSPEYRKALQELIKFELQALVERLSATGEEALVLTASVQDGSSTQFGSHRAECFLSKRSCLEQEFLNFCSDEVAASSADELCHYGDELEEDEAKEELNSCPSDVPIQFSPLRTRERTNSLRISFSENDAQENLDEASQNSDIFATERNNCASSVASFHDASEKDPKDQSGVKKNLQCRVCCRNFRSYKTLEQHTRLHMAKSYKCSFCGKIFSMKKSYLKHVKNHKHQSSDKIFECRVCNQSFTDLMSWKRHKECHCEVQKFSCNLCGKSFNEKYSLRVHQTSHFFSTQKLDKNSDTTAGQSCNTCGKLSKTKAAMRNHMLSHSVKKFSCEYCNKRFSVRYSYIRHRRIHTGERPYKCVACTRSFSDGSAWSKHIKTHTGIKPYSCDLCSKSFYYKANCKTHMKKVHNIQGKKVVTAMTAAVAKTEKDKKPEYSLLVSGIENEYHAAKEFDAPLNFAIPTAEDEIFGGQLNLQLDESDKESEVSNLLGSAFGQDIMSSTEKDDFTNMGESHDNNFTSTSIMESLVLDEKFQTEFVERNLPDRAIESDHDFISAEFPEESEILVNEMESNIQEQKDLKTNSRDQVVVLPSSLKTQKKTWAARKTFNGKPLPESPAKCKICHKKFKQESVLKQHLQFHCMLKLYKCRYCGKQLSTKNSLIRHERIHVGDRPWQCSMCNKTFADNYGCIRHINTHFKKDDKSSVKTSQDIYTSNFSDYTATALDNSLEMATSMPPFVAANDISADLSAGNMDSAASISINGTSSSEVSDPSACILPVIDSQSAVISDSWSTCLSGPASSLPYQQSNEEEEQAFLQHTNTIHNGKPVNEGQSDSRLHTETEECKPAVAKEKKYLYKCAKCCSFFHTELLCIDHIKQSCGKICLNLLTVDKPQQDNLAGQSVVNSSSTSSESETYLSHIQCSICYSIFKDKASCQLHISNGCRDPDKKPMTTQVESTVQPLQTQAQFLQAETHSFISGKNQAKLLLTSTSTPSSIFSVIADKDVGSNTIIAVSRQNTGSSNMAFIPYPGTHISTQNLSGIHTAATVSKDSQFTTLIQKPATPVGLLTTQTLIPQGLGTLTCNQLPGKSDKKKNSGDESERTCPLCHKVFTNKHILKQHTLIHMDRKFGCKYCMKKFHNKYGRDRHERIHTGEMPFSCPSCKKAFRDNSTFRKHTRLCCPDK
ncbi:zinc finger protein Xfin-like isoform X2 [Dreissena polymorpha]|uniref:zinc finger protein Xfin-like isoform X2 n=1 Tax=Dreissena polymorpha TaxID=45954 RepID=UPI002265693C|nr:zinc finger protein Xfin-like isoform X2 [Dreissena polymorpha]